MQSIEDQRIECDLSVVLATRNRAEQLVETLQAYERLDTASLSWELVVVDNASTDDTAAVLDRARDRLPLVVLYTADSGKNRALNTALGRLHGELIVFTDDDVLPATDCLQAYAGAARRWPEHAIFGARIEPSFPADTPQWLSSPAFFFGTTAFARYQPATSEGVVSRHPFGPSFAVRHRALADYRFPGHLGPQGQAYAMGGEAGLLRAMAANGHAFVYVPSAQVQHVVRPEQLTEQWLMQRAHNKGRGQIYLPSRKKTRRLRVGGVPLRLILACLRSFLRYQLLRWTRDQQRRVQHGIQYALRRGQIEELHRQASAKPELFDGN